MYWIGWFFFRLVYFFIWRVKIIGIENIPKNGPAIIASNHLSLADPPLVGCSIKRKISYMAKKELFSIPVFGEILKIVNAFPVQRDEPDPKAIKNAIKILLKGNIVLMFPQGGRREIFDKEKYSKYKYGIGMISCWSSAPVIPCKIINSNMLKNFCRLKVEFMKPIPPPKKFSRQDYENLAEVIMEKIL